MAGSLVDIAASGDLKEIIERGIAYAIIVAGFLSVAYIFFGGITFILSGGQEDKIKQSFSTIRYAIIGFVITIFSVVIVNVVGKAMGLDVVRYLNFQHIVELVRQISSDDGGGSGINSLD